MAAGGATHARVTSDRPIARVTVLALADGEPNTVTRRTPANSAGASVSVPNVLPRAAWGADESYRFRGQREIWPPDFHRVQKLIVHHTATTSNPPDPAAAIRAIYYYHAVTQGWGDIAYNFLVDQNGLLYEGRYSKDLGPGQTPTGEDEAGRVVTAGHTYQHNVGTVGVAVLGTFTEAAPPPDAAVAAVMNLFEWEVDHHHLDPPW